MLTREEFDKIEKAFLPYVRQGSEEVASILQEVRLLLKENFLEEKKENKEIERKYFYMNKNYDLVYIYDEEFIDSDDISGLEYRGVILHSGIHQIYKSNGEISPRNKPKRTAIPLDLSRKYRYSKYALNGTMSVAYDAVIFLQKVE
jgi:hypothetical protein